MKRRVPLEHRAKLIRRTALRPRSAKRERLYRENRRPFVERILRERPVCEWPDCRKDSVDVHELKTRARGGSITDDANVRAVCRHHHDVVHSDPALAAELGWLLNSWEEPA